MAISSTFPVKSGAQFILDGDDESLSAEECVQKQDVYLGTVYSGITLLASNSSFGGRDDKPKIDQSKTITHYEDGRLRSATLVEDYHEGKYIFSKGVETVFYSDGTVAYGVLADKYTINDIEWPVGTKVSFYQKTREFRSATTSKDVLLPKSGLIVAAYNEVFFYPDGSPLMVVLKKDATIMGVKCMGGEWVTFFPNGKLHRAVLASDQEIQDYSCSEGELVYFLNNGKLDKVIPAMNDFPVDKIAIKGQVGEKYSDFYDFDDQTIKLLQGLFIKEGNEKNGAGFRAIDEYYKKLGKIAIIKERDVKFNGGKATLTIFLKIQDIPTKLVVLRKLPLDNEDFSDLLDDVFGDLKSGNPYTYQEIEDGVKRLEDGLFSMGYAIEMREHDRRKFDISRGQLVLLLTAVPKSSVVFDDEHRYRFSRNSFSDSVNVNYKYRFTETKTWFKNPLPDDYPTNNFGFPSSDNLGYGCLGTFGTLSRQECYCSSYGTKNYFLPADREYYCEKVTSTEKRDDINALFEFKDLPDNMARLKMSY